MSIISRMFKEALEEKDEPEAPGEETIAQRTLPPVFCVSLMEEPWKRTKAMLHFKERGICPTFVDGVQGVTIGLRATNPYDYDQHGSPLYAHISQLGCALSHRIALSVAIAHGAPEFIICEDDVLLPDNFVGLYLSFRTALPPDAEVAQLEYSGADDKPQIPVNERVKQVFYPFCAACIWWTRSAAKRALSLMRPFDRPYDILLVQRVYPFLNHYVPAHPIAGQRSSQAEWPSAVGDAPKIE